MKKLSKTTLGNFLTYALVIVAFIICQSMVNAGAMSRSLRGQLIPICVYIVMAVSLNLTAVSYTHLDVYKRQVEGRLPTAIPAVLGHEGAGEVVKVGPGVTEFQPGDRVGFSFAYCNACANCYAGRPASCLKFNQINFGGVLPDGTSRLSQNGRTLSMFFGQSSFAEYAVVAAQSAVKVPYDDVDLAVVAPMGCGIQTGAGTVLNLSLIHI